MSLPWFEIDEGEQHDGGWLLPPRWADGVAVGDEIPIVWAGTGDYGRATVIGRTVYGSAVVRPV